MVKHVGPMSLAKAKPFQDSVTFDADKFSLVIRKEDHIGAHEFSGSKETQDDPEMKRPAAVTITKGRGKKKKVTKVAIPKKRVQKKRRPKKVDPDEGPRGKGGAPGGQVGDPPPVDKDPPGQSKKATKKKTTKKATKKASSK